MFEYNFPDLPIICKYDYQYNYRGELRSKLIYALLTDYDKETRKYCAIRMLEDGKAFGRHDVTWMYWAKEDILKYQVGMDELPSKVMASVKEHLQMEEEIQERQRKRLQRMLQSLNYAYKAICSTGAARGEKAVRCCYRRKKTTGLHGSGGWKTGNAICNPKGTKQRDRQTAFYIWDKKLRYKLPDRK